MFAWGHAPITPFIVIDGDAAIFAVAFFVSATLPKGRAATPCLGHDGCCSGEWCDARGLHIALSGN